MKRLKGEESGFSLLHVETASNCKAVWCGVLDVTWCLICVWSSTSSFLMLLSLFLAAVSCDLDEPASWFAHMEEAGFQKVPEDDSTTASRVSCLWELHWDKLDFSAVRLWSVSLMGGLASNPDVTQRFWSQRLVFKNPFMYFVFSFLLLSVVLLFYSVFLKSVMVQTESSLLFIFHYSELWYSSLVFAVPCILSLW